jgi:hypothetical protein
VAYGGESNAKKLARWTAWWQALDFMPDGGSQDALKKVKALAIAGPEAADIRVLRGSGVLPENVVAVDVDPDAIESSRAIVPEATYLHGDFVDICRHRRYRRVFDLLFIDLCSTLGDDVLIKTMQAVAFAGRHRCVVILGHMYGREQGDAASAIKSVAKDKEAFWGDPENVAEVGGPASTEAQERMIVKKVAALTSRHSVVNAAFQIRARTHGLSVVSLGFVAYRSGRRFKGRSCGVPMLYHIFWCSRLARRTRREEAQTCLAMLREARQIRRFTGTEESGVHVVGDDPDGVRLRDEALRLSDVFGTAEAADLMNLKPMQIAAWRAWRTRRIRAAEAAGEPTDGLDVWPRITVSVRYADDP